MQYVRFALCSLVWSASFILMKKAALGYTPLGIGAWRCVWGAAVVGLLCWRSGLLAIPRRGSWLTLALVTLIGCTWPYAVQPAVVARQGSAFMALVVSVVPLATILVSIPLLRVWPTARQLVGVCGALACLGILLADGVARRVAWTDFAMAISVPLSYATANTVIRGWLRDLHSLTLTFYLLTLTAILLLPASLIEPPRTVSAKDWLTACWSLAALGVVGTGLATYWFNQLIRDQGPLFAGMTTNLVPIGAVLWGWVDHEHVTLRQLIALVGIVALVVWVQLGTIPMRRPAPGDSS